MQEGREELLSWQEEELPEEVIMPEELEELPEEVFLPEELPEEELPEED